MFRYHIQAFHHQKSSTTKCKTLMHRDPTDNDDVKVETIGGKYRLKKVRLDMDAQVEKLDLLIPWLDLLRSDHARFWYHNLDYPTSFPAVLITDTGRLLSSRKCGRVF